MRDMLARRELRLIVCKKGSRQLQSWFLDRFPIICIGREHRFNSCSQRLVTSRDIVEKSSALPRLQLNSGLKQLIYLLPAFRGHVEIYDAA